MEKKRKQPVWLYIVLAVVVVLAVVLLVNRYAVRQVWCNAFAPNLPIDDSTTWAGGTAYERVPYATGSDAQYLDLYVPNTPEKAPLFVLVHGGGFVSGDSQTKQAQYMYRYFRDHGFACASINYRLAQEAPFPAACADVKAAVRFLVHNAETYGFDAERIAIWGESAGGYLAAFTALTAPDAYTDVPCIGETEAERFTMPSFDALVDYYGVLDFNTFDEDFVAEGTPLWIVKMANGWANNITGEFDSFEEYWLRKAQKDWTDYESNEANVLYHATNRENGNPSLKTLILHGDADLTVSHLQSVKLDAILKANGEDTTLKLVPKCKHADDRLYTDDMLGEVAAFVTASFTD